MATGDNNLVWLSKVTFNEIISSLILPKLFFIDNVELFVLVKIDTPVIKFETIISYCVFVLFV